MGSIISRVPLPCLATAFNFLTNEEHHAASQVCKLWKSASVENPSIPTTPLVRTVKDLSKLGIILGNQPTITKMELLDANGRAPSDGGWPILSVNEKCMIWACNQNNQTLINIFDEEANKTIESIPIPHYQRFNNNYVRLLTPQHSEILIFSLDGVGSSLLLVDVKNKSTKTIDISSALKELPIIKGQTRAVAWILAIKDRSESLYILTNIGFFIIWDLSTNKYQFLRCIPQEFEELVNTESAVKVGSSIYISAKQSLFANPHPHLHSATSSLFCLNLNTKEIGLLKTDVDLNPLESNIKYYISNNDSYFVQNYLNGTVECYKDGKIHASFQDIFHMFFSLRSGKFLFVYVDRRRSHGVKYKYFIWDPAKNLKTKEVISEFHSDRFPTFFFDKDILAVVGQHETVVHHIPTGFFYTIQLNLIIHPKLYVFANKGLMELNIRSIDKDNLYLLQSHSFKNVTNQAMTLKPFAPTVVPIIPTAVSSNVVITPVSSKPIVKPIVKQPRSICVRFANMLQRILFLMKKFLYCKR